MSACKVVSPILLVVAVNDRPLLGDTTPRRTIEVRARNCLDEVLSWPHIAFEILS